MKPALLLALIALVKCAAVRNHDGVEVLDKETFTPFVTDNKHVLVQFCVPLSLSCKSLEPEYLKAAEKLNDLKSDIKLAKVDAIALVELAEKHKFHVFPTFKFFRNGKPSDYNGGITAYEIVNWVLQKTGHFVKAIRSFVEAKEFVSFGDFFVLGAFKDLDSDAAKQFFAAFYDNNNGRDVLFGISPDVEAVNHQYGVSGDKSIILFDEVDDTKVVFKGDIISEAIVKFIETNSLPLVIEFTNESSLKIFGGEIKNIYYLLICVGKSHEKINQIKSAAKEGAKAFKGKVMFMTVDTDDVVHQPMLDFFGMKKDEFPAMLLIHHSSTEEITKYKRASVDLTEKNIKTFVQAVLDGTVKPDLLSEEILKDWDKNPVKTLVSKNFDRVVFDKTKDVLVEFYVSNWCEQCKQLEPAYIELAEKYKGDETIVIAKMNCMANELEHTKITRFPTFKLYQKGDNKVITFKGQPTLERFSEFLDVPFKMKSVFRQEL